MSKNIFRYAQNMRNILFNQLQVSKKKSFATRKILQSLVFDV